MKVNFTGVSMLALTLSTLSVPAVAQVAVATATAAPDEDEEIIIVSANRRDSDILTTPIAITAVSGAELESRGIVDATKFDNLVPNLKINDQSGQGAGAINITIRGIGNSSFIEIGDPNVALHVDGVYTARPQAGFNLLFDAQRMEVARGPQGTLYGRNATVGAINIINNRPDASKFSFGASVGYGRFDENTVGAVLNVPIITDILAVRATALYRRRDTMYNLFNDDVAESIFRTRFGFNLDDSPYRKRYGRGLTDNKGAGSIQQFTYRLSAQLTPIEDLSIYGSYEHFDNESPFNPLTTTDAPYSAWLSTPHFLDQKIESIRGEIKYDAFDTVELKGVYGKQNYFHENLFDLDGGQVRFSPEYLCSTGSPRCKNRQAGDVIDDFEQTFYDRAWETESQSFEITAASSYDSRLQWLAGYYNFQENTARNLWIDLPFTADGLINFNQPDREATTEAYFGRLEWQVTDQIKLTGGARRSKDRRADTNVNRFDRFPGNSDFGGYGVPFLIDQAGLTDLEYLCSRGPQVGPCAGLNSPHNGAAINLRNNPGAPIPGLTQGFGAAVGSPIYRIQQGILAATASGATLFNGANNQPQLDAIAALLSSGGQVGLLGPAAAFPRVFSPTRTSEYTDWNFTAEFEPMDGTYIYATVATGHKAGSQEIFYQPRLGQFINSILKPEKVTNYEIGVKQKFDNGLNVQLTGFYMDYKDKQQSVFVNGGDLFCDATFGDFNGDGYLENFVQFLSGVPIFSASAGLINGGGARLRPDIIGVDGQPSWELNAASIASAIAGCSRGSTPAGGPLANNPGVPDFVELLQINFGDAKIAGLELEYQWKISPDTRLTGFGTWNIQNELSNANADALPFILVDSLNCGDRTVATGCESVAAVDGNQLAFAPEFTFRAQIEHDFHLGTSGSKLTPRVGVTYNSSYYLNIFNVGCYDSVRLGETLCNEGDKVDAYTIVDANLRYEHGDGKIWAEIYGNNILGTTYKTNIVRPTSADNKSLYSFNERPTYGLRVGARF